MNFYSLKIVFFFTPLAGEIMNFYSVKISFFFNPPAFRISKVTFKQGGVNLSAFEKLVNVKHRNLKIEYSNKIQKNHVKQCQHKQVVKLQ